MMQNLQSLVSYTDSLLRPGLYKDYCPNGLQVEGREQVERIVGGVSASLAVIEQAIDMQADVLLVHHGFFWRGEDARIIGNKARRIRALIEAGVSLLAYHLPLDAHDSLGNNAQLAELLGFEVEGGFAKNGEVNIGMHGSLHAPVEAAALQKNICNVLQREPLYIQGHERQIKKIAWCSGGAQSYFEQAVELGVDAFLTGEASEQNYHQALEYGVDFIAAGHHATERYGVQALGKHLAEKFNLGFEFIELNNPI